MITPLLKLSESIIGQLPNNWNGDLQQVGSVVNFGVNVTRPECLTWDGTNLYMASGSRLYTLSRTTGIATRVGRLGNFGIGGESLNPTGLAWDGSTLYMIAGIHLYSINRTTGRATRISGSQGFRETFTRFGQTDTIRGNGLAWDGTNLYMVSRLSDALYIVNRSTGVATRVGSAVAFGATPEVYDPEGLAWDGNRLYLFDATSGLYYVNRSTGVATLIRSDIENHNVRGAAWDGENLYAVRNQIRTIDDEGKIEHISGGSLVTSLHIEPSPANLTAIVVNSTTVRLDWNSVSRADEYEYDFSTILNDDRVFFTPGSTTKRSAGVSTTVNVSGLAPDTEYKFVHRYRIGSVWSYASAGMVLRTSQIVTSPTLPAAVSVETLGVGGLRVSWTNPTGDFTNNQIRWRAPDGNYNVAQNVSPAKGTSYDITGLSKGVSYSVQVRSVNAGRPSEWTTAINGIPLGIPDAPTMALSSADSALDVSFAPPGNTGGSALTAYRIRWRTPANTGTWSDYVSLTPGLTSYQIRRLVNGTEYEVELSAQNTLGWSVATSRTATPMTGEIAAMITGFTGVKKAAFSIGVDFSHTGTGSSAVSGFTTSDVTITHVSGESLSTSGLQDFTITTNGDNRFLINFTPSSDKVGVFSVSISGSVSVRGRQLNVSVGSVTVSYNTVGVVAAEFEDTSGIKIRDFVILLRFDRVVSGVEKTDINLTDVSGDTIAESGLLDFTITQDATNRALWRLVFTPDTGFSGTFSINFTGQVVSGSVSRPVSIGEKEVTFLTTGVDAPQIGLVTIGPPENPVGQVADQPFTGIELWHDITFSEDLPSDMLLQRLAGAITLRDTNNVGPVNVLAANLQNVGTSGTRTHFRLRVPIPEDTKGSYWLEVAEDFLNNNLTVSSSEVVYDRTTPDAENNVDSIVWNIPSNIQSANNESVEITVTASFFRNGESVELILFPGAISAKGIEGATVDYDIVFGDSSVDITVTVPAVRNGSLYLQFDIGDATDPSDYPTQTLYSPSIPVNTNAIDDPVHVLEWILPDEILEDSVEVASVIFSRPLTGAETLVPSDINVEGVDGVTVTSVAVDPTNAMKYDVTLSISKGSKGVLELNIID